MVALYCAYGSTSVVGTIGNSSGTITLSGFGTKRETAMFLDGMRHALFLVPCNCDECAGESGIVLTTQDVNAMVVRDDS
jgi:hypothetical protein